MFSNSNFLLEYLIYLHGSFFIELYMDIMQGARKYQVRGSYSRIDFEFVK